MKKLFFMNFALILMASSSLLASPKAPPNSVFCNALHNLTVVAANRALREFPLPRENMSEKDIQVQAASFGVIFAEMMKNNSGFSEAQASILEYEVGSVAYCAYKMPSVGACAANAAEERRKNKICQ